MFCSLESKEDVDMFNIKFFFISLKATGTSDSIGLTDSNFVIQKVIG